MANHQIIGACFILLMASSSEGYKYKNMKRRNSIISRDLVINSNTICGNKEGLSNYQMDLCRRQPTLFASAWQGILVAINECKNQFRNNRWNCSVLQAQHKIPHSNLFLERGYRETAFTVAIASAGVAHQVAEACSLGKIPECNCNTALSASQKRHVRKQLDEDAKATAIFERSGCNRGINKGLAFAAEFLDSRESSNDIISRSIIHNNRVGRLAVARTKKEMCKCHGMSASCSFKTCWQKPAEFHVIGETIKQKYLDAVLAQANMGNGARDGNQIVQVVDGRGVPKEDLLFYEESPSYCKPDPSIDYDGTKGRFCKHDSPPYCSDLCCRRGYHTVNMTRTEHCNCRFHWCCRIECNTCTWTEEVSICN